jgi:heme exporter protein A
MISPAGSSSVEDSPGRPHRGAPWAPLPKTAEIGSDRALDLAIEVTGLTRRFGHQRALDALDLQVPWDQRLAVLGPNGAGKSTLLRILATLGRPTAGRVAIGGLPLPAQATAIRRNIGFVGHQTFLYDELTVAENLVFYGRLYRVPDLARRVSSLLDRVGLASRAGERVRTLSRGLQQRATLARAVLHDPPILLWDEPDTGLDVTGDDLLPRLFVDESGRPRTVILTTHQLHRALALADRVVVLQRGRLTYDRSAAACDLASLSAVIRDDRVPR